MGSKSKPAPAAPDYTRLAQEQARLQNELLDKQTQNNRVNQVNPMGSLTWEQDPATGQWRQVESWNPEVMKAYQDQLGWAGTQRDFESERMDFERQRMEQESQRMQQQMGYDKTRADYEVQRMKQSGAFEAELMDYERSRMGYGKDQMAKAGAYNDQRAAFEGQKMGWAGEQMGFAREQMDWARQAKDKISALGNRGEFSGGPAVPTYDGGYDSGYAQNFAKSALMRVLPQQAREQEALTNKLRLQGLQPGTEGFNRAYSQMVTAHGDVQAKAQIDGQLAGTNAAREAYLAQLQGQSQGFDQSYKSYLLPWQTAQMEMGMASGLGQGIGQGIGNGVGGDIYGDAGSGIAYGLGSGSGAAGSDIYGGAGSNIGSGYGSGIGGPGAPNYQGYTPAGMGQAPEILNAAQQTYAQQMQAYNEQQQKKSGKGGAIGSLVGAVGGSFFGMPTLGASVGGGIGSAFSDMRLKSDVELMTDIECYEKLKKIVPISWRWNGTSVRDSGISAQEILAELPHLTDRAERGMLAVNYTALFAMLLGAFRHLATLAEAPKESGNAAV